MQNSIAMQSVTQSTRGKLLKEEVKKNIQYFEFG